MLIDGERSRTIRGIYWRKVRLHVLAYFRKGPLASAKRQLRAPGVAQPVRHGTCKGGNRLFFFFSFMKTCSDGIAIDRAAKDRNGGLNPLPQFNSLRYLAPRLAFQGLQLL